MYEEERRPSLVGRIFKALAIAIMFAVYGILFVRFFVSCDSPLVEKIIKTDTIVASYENDENFEIRKYVFTDFHRNINDGKLLMLNNMYHFPSTDELQISVKFNKDILTYHGDEFPFEFYLEDETLATYSDYIYEYDERYDFGYIRISFKGISLEKTPQELDENGLPVMKNYQMYIRMRDSSGEFRPFHDFSIYLGDRNYKKIQYAG